MQSDPIGLWAGDNFFVYAGLSPLYFVDPLGLFNMVANELYDPREDRYKYEYRFIFKSCVVHGVEQGTNRVIRGLRRIGRIRRALPDRRAGDVDIEGWRLRCQCRGYDDDLKRLFNQHFSGSRLNREQADRALRLLRTELRRLENEEDCDQCSKAYDWDNLISTSEDRAWPSLHRLARRK